MWYFSLGLLQHEQGLSFCSVMRACQHDHCSSQLHVQKLRLLPYLNCNPVSDNDDWGSPESPVQAASLSSPGLLTILVPELVLDAFQECKWHLSAKPAQLER